MLERLTRRTLVALGLTLASSTASAWPTNLPISGPVRFVFVGDTGTGGKGQYAVAAAMEAVCAERGCQFALDAGDNIYENGVRSAGDAQFERKFEAPYRRLPFPFFLALGNHDESGVIPGSGVHPENGEYEIAYSQRSTKWTLPARYYRFAAPFAKPDDWRTHADAPIIEFFVIDTNPLAPQNVPQHDWYRPLHEFDLAQRRWLDGALASSTARWKVVLGHHPYRNDGMQRNAGEFFGLGAARGGELERMVEDVVCGKADFLFTGHDHSLQWLPAYAPCGPRPQFVISGAGSKTNGPHVEDPAARSNHALWESFGKLGFFWVEATADRITLAAYTVEAGGRPKLAFERDVRPGF